jgi:hypothetical protein
MPLAAADAHMLIDQRHELACAARQFWHGAQAKMKFPGRALNGSKVRCATLLIRAGWTQPYSKMQRAVLCHCAGSPAALA